MNLLDFKEMRFSIRVSRGTILLCVTAAVAIAIVHFYGILPGMLIFIAYILGDLS